jgi:hypothetical protein
VNLLTMKLISLEIEEATQHRLRRTAAAPLKVCAASPEMSDNSE